MHAVHQRDSGHRIGAPWASTLCQQRSSLASSASFRTITRGRHPTAPAVSHPAQCCLVLHVSGPCLRGPSGVQRHLSMGLRPAEPSDVRSTQSQTNSAVDNTVVACVALHGTVQCQCKLYAPVRAGHELCVMLQALCYPHQQAFPPAVLRKQLPCSVMPFAEPAASACMHACCA